MFEEFISNFERLWIRSKRCAFIWIPR